MQHGILKCQNEKINGSKLSVEFFAQNKYSSGRFWNRPAARRCAAPRTHHEVVLGGLIPIQFDEILGIVLGH